MLWDCRAGVGRNIWVEQRQPLFFFAASEQNEMNINYVSSSPLMENFCPSDLYPHIYHLKSSSIAPKKERKKIILWHQTCSNLSVNDVHRHFSHDWKQKSAVFTCETFPTYETRMKTRSAGPGQLWQSSVSPTSSAAPFLFFSTFLTRLLTPTVWLVIK